MAKLVALNNSPADPAAFDAYYECRHLPDVHLVPVPPLVPHVEIPQVPVFFAPKWEYKHLARGADAPALDEAELNTLGSEGWELVGVLTDARAAHFYFKREAR